MVRRTLNETKTLPWLNAFEQNLTDRAFAAPPCARTAPAVIARLFLRDFRDSPAEPVMTAPKQLYERPRDRFNSL